MRWHSLVVTAVLACGFGVFSGCAHMEEPEPAPAEPADPMAEWAKWMELQAPGEHHAQLAALAGEWDVASTFWMMPGQPPVESTAKATFTSILNGRYLQLDFAGDVAGMPFQGLALIGYDNFKQKQITCWIDSTGTGFFLTEGETDPETGVTTEEGGMPMSPDGPPIPHRMVTTPDGDDRFVMEMFTPGEDGEWTRNMKLVYERKTAK